MRVRRMLFLIPAILLPYVVLLELHLLFSKSPILDTVFHGNGLLLLPVLLGITVLSVIITVVAFAVSISKGWDSLSLARAVMIAKLIQIPAYLAIFILGLMFMVTIFLYVFSIIFIIIDCITIFMTGLLGTASVILASRQGKWNESSSLVFALLGFIFCVDVVSSVVFYIKLKRRYREQDT